MRQISIYIHICIYKQYANIYLYKSTHAGTHTYLHMYYLNMYKL